MLRKSSGPLRPWRRLRASRTASLRVSGAMALRRATSSSRLACMKSMSSGSGLRTRLGHRLRPPVGDQPAADLGLDLPAQGVQAGLVLLPGQPLLEVGQLTAGLLAGGLHHPLQHGVEVELAEGAVQVVGAADRPARLHAGVAGDGGAGDGAQHGVVAVHQGPVEQLGQLLRGQPLGAAALALPGAEQVVDQLVDRRRRRRRRRRCGTRVPAARSTPRRRSRRPSSGRCSSPGGGQGVLERLPVLERDVAQGLHGIEVLGQADRDARPCAAP